MNAAHLSLTFSVSGDDTLDTLEAVLAIARRGGARLGAMAVTARVTVNDIAIALQAAEADQLDLFLARLRNLYCVENIVVHAQAAGLHGSLAALEVHQAPHAPLGHTGCLCQSTVESP